MKLKEIFRGVLSTGGIFSKIDELYHLPFKDMINDLKALDFDFIVKYGNRETSALLDEIIDGNYLVVKRGNDYVVDTKDDRVFIKSPFTREEMYEVISVIIYQRYKIQWEKLFNTMKVVYNPIHNYDMNEVEKVDTNMTTSTSSNSSSNANNFGFNSVESTPVSEDGNTSSNTSNVTGTGDQNKRVLERSGNIGVTTSQTMLTDERNVWMYDFIDVVFKQVADMLTCKYYF